MGGRLHLPSLLNEIADVAGVAAALAIAEARGGTRVHFPAAAPPGHWLNALVGEDASKKLCAHFRTTAQGGVYLDVPLGPVSFYDRAKVLALDLRGKASASEAALQIGVSERSIYNWWADARAREYGER